MLLFRLVRATIIKEKDSYYSLPIFIINNMTLCKRGISCCVALLVTQLNPPTLSSLSFLSSVMVGATHRYELDYIQKGCYYFWNKGFSFEYSSNVKHHRLNSTFSLSYNTSIAPNEDVIYERALLICLAVIKCFCIALE